MLFFILGKANQIFLVSNVSGLLQPPVKKSGTHFAPVLIAIAGLDRDASIVRTNRTIRDTQDDLADSQSRDSPHRFYFGRAVRSHVREGELYANGLM